MMPCSAHVLRMFYDFSTYGLVWAPADAPLRELQSLQHSFLCRVKNSVPIEIIFQELSVTRWHYFWWRQVLSFWNGVAQADSGSIINIVLHDAMWLSTGAAMAGLHRSSNALLSMASPAHWWLVLLLRCSLMSCYWPSRCSGKPPWMLYLWTLDLALARG